MTHILVFGDNITWGAWDRRGGWVQRLRDFLDDKNLSLYENFLEVYNMGVSANTTKDLLKRFDFETKQRLGEEDNRIIIFAIGTNDSLYVKTKTENDPNVPLEIFQRNLNVLIRNAQKYSRNIIFIGLFPVDENMTQPFGASKSGKCYDNENLEKYENVIATVSKQNRVGFVPIFSNAFRSDYKRLLEDGLHPNSEGHQKMFEIIRDYLARNKMI